MRIAAKRLRYLMQALAPLYPDALAAPIQAARLCQTRLGDIHDGDMWIDTLPRFLEEEQARTLAYFGNTHPSSRYAWACSPCTTIASNSGCRITRSL